MFLKVLSIIWIIMGASLSSQWASPWLNSFEQQRLIRNAILSTQPDTSLVSQLRAKALSRQIHKASQCFEIDPFVFTALIWRESNFKNESKSPTGAVGLTQLTKPGVQEVIDRVARRSSRKNEVMRQRLSSCYPKIFKTFPASPSQVDLQAWKKRIAQSQELSLVFGAILFKTYFKGSYLKALERYNGEPEVKARFAREVMALSMWISSSFRVIPEADLENSKFLASIQDL